jgi:hypothetical protein
MGVISGRVYLIIAIAIFAMLLAVQLLGGSAGMVDFLNTVKINAANAGLGATVADFVLVPIIWVFETQYYGPAVGGLLWPIAVVWLFLFVIVWIFSLIAPGFKDIPGA